MAGGPLFPFSYYPSSSNVFASIHAGAGASCPNEEGLGVSASLSSDASWCLRFMLPPTLPSGTAKLRLVALANATAGDAKVNPKWASVAMEEAPSQVTLNMEGTQTVTWATGDNDQYKELKVTLDADTLVAGEIVTMELVFETVNWTLAAISTWQVAIIWE